jgi:hypothetical protein
MVANRRSLATRIAVTRGTASLISAGSGPRWGADAIRVVGTAVAVVRTLVGVGAAGGAESERTTRPVPGLSAGAGGGFRAAGGFDFGVDSGFFAASLTAGGVDSGFLGFDSGDFAGTLTAGAGTLRAGGAGSVALGLGGRAVTPGAGTLASVGGGTGAFGVDVFGRGSVTSGCMRALGMVVAALADAGFVGLAAGLFGATVPAGGFRAAGTFTAPFDSGFFGFDSGDVAGTLTADAASRRAGAPPALPLL